MLNTVYKNIVIFRQNFDKDKIRFRTFKKDTQLDSIIHLIDKQELDNGFIKRECIKNLEINVKQIRDKKMGL